MSINYQMTVERYSKPKGVVGGLIRNREIFYVVGVKTSQSPYASYVPK